MTTMTTLPPSLAANLQRLLAEHDPATTDPASFLAARFDLGLAWVQHREGDGGLAADPSAQGPLDEALAVAGAPDPFIRNPIGLGMVGPTIATHGTPEQRARHLRPMFSGEEIWCQLFSEPGAGSDLAGLSTRARRTDDGWVVSGQKVWTSLADRARWGFLVARTDPDVPKHRGLTCFIVDMTAPGVTVRPIREMTGQAHFNEVFFDDVAVPDDARVGEVGAGWQVALTMLMNERVAVGGMLPARGGGHTAVLMETWRRHGNGDPALAERVADAWIDAEVLRLTNERAQRNRIAGTPGPEGSIAKLSWTEHVQAISDLCLDLVGPGAMEYGYGSGADPMPNSGDADPVSIWLRMRAMTIEGGTSEIQRDIIATRVLGLPAPTRADRSAPWSSLPRNA